MASGPSSRLERPAQGSSGSSFNTVSGACGNSGVGSPPKVRASKLNATPQVPLAQLVPQGGPCVSSYVFGWAQPTSGPSRLCQQGLLSQLWLLLPTRHQPEDTGKAEKAPKDTSA